MKTFITSLLVKALSDPKVQAALLKLLGEVIAKYILPLIPVASAAAAKAAVDQIVERVPGLEGVVDVVKVADDSRSALNDLIPDVDFGIPALDELLDIWRPKG